MNKLSVVLYKNQPAVVNDRDGDKYIIKFCSQPATPGGKKAVYGEQKVREKDVVLLHEGPCSSLEAVLACDCGGAESLKAKLLEAYELLMSDESTASQAVSLSDLAEYSIGSFKADEAWALYSAANSDLHFQLSQDALKNGEVCFTLRSAEEIETLNKKQYEKEHEAEIRAAFIKRVRERKLDLPEDAKFMGEVEAFALCKTEKSKVLQDAGVAQTIEAAHKLLIETGIWDFTGAAGGYAGRRAPVCAGSGLRNR